VTKTWRLGVIYSGGVMRPLEQPLKYSCNFMVLLMEINIPLLAFLCRLYSKWVDPRNAEKAFTTYRQDFQEPSAKQKRNARLNPELEGFSAFPRVFLWRLGFGV
jgi:hypothetical protein